jgi:hypothetical protein
VPLDTAAWFIRGRELRCFPDDGAAASYLSAYQTGDAGSAKWELERIFAGPHRMPAVNWLAFEGLITAIETGVEDGPQKFVEDYQPSDFDVRPWGGGVGGPQLAGGAGWDSLMVDLVQSFLFLGAADKVSAAQSMAAAVRLAASQRPLTLSGLARAATAALFIATAGPGSPQLQAAVPDWSAVGGLGPALKARAEAVVAQCWSTTIGAALLGAPAPLTLYGVRGAALVSDVDALLAGAYGPRNANLIAYLRCLDPY